MLTTRHITLQRQRYCAEHRMVRSLTCWCTTESTPIKYTSAYHVYSMRGTKSGKFRIPHPRWGLAQARIDLKPGVVFFAWGEFSIHSALFPIHSNFFRGCSTPLGRSAGKNWAQYYDCTSFHMSCHIRKLLIPETIPVYQSRVEGGTIKNRTILRIGFFAWRAVRDQRNSVMSDRRSAK